MRDRYVFVGEKRSRRAMAMNVWWSDGKLAAKTLFGALRAAGLDPNHQICMNIYLDGDGWEVDWLAKSKLPELVAEGWVVVGMGKRVQRELTTLGVPHLSVVHPAARGKIRATTVYQAHFATALGRLQMDTDQV